MRYHTKTCIHILNLGNGMCDNRIHMAYKYPLSTFHKTNFSSFMQSRTVWNWLQFVYTIVGPYEKTLSAHFFKYSFLNRWGYNRWLCQCNTILESYLYPLLSHKLVLLNTYILALILNECGFEWKGWKAINLWFDNEICTQSYILWIPVKNGKSKAFSSYYIF